MTRALHASTEAAVIAETVLRAMAVDLDFSTGPVRLNTTFDTLTIGGQEFLPAGTMGSISAVEESAELAATTLRLTLSGVPRGMASIALGESYQNRTAVLWEVVLNPDTLAIVGDPVKVFAGRMDVMRVSYAAETCTVELDVTNRLVDWERPRRVLFSDEEHLRRTGGADRSFRYAAAMADADLTWPTGLYFTRVVGPASAFS